MYSVVVVILYIITARLKLVLLCINVLSFVLYMCAENEHEITLTGEKCHSACSVCF